MEKLWTLDEAWSQCDRITGALYDKMTEINMRESQSLLLSDSPAQSIVEKANLALSHLGACNPDSSAIVRDILISIRTIAQFIRENDICRQREMVFFWSNLSSFKNKIQTQRRLLEKTKEVDYGRSTQADALEKRIKTWVDQVEMHDPEGTVPIPGEFDYSGQHLKGSPVTQAKAMIKSPLKTSTEITFKICDETVLRNLHNDNIHTVLNHHRQLIAKRYHLRTLHLAVILDVFFDSDKGLMRVMAKTAADAEVIERYAPLWLKRFGQGAYIVRQKVH
ncbi:hypothetical protein PISL3812_09064 [Talaromyces islandicus]|uniref:Uncharacterized protein n=1 Tax=Talaromyces islandicus TaxID=28573 RepID=A0A0U1MAK6_TALIS|nr:hypothetical protein PISL3812_09064 [Talaromyces islandicus]